MTSKLFCRRTLSCRLCVHSSPGCQAAKLPLQGGGGSAPPHHDWQHLLPGGCPKWPPCPLSFPSWPCPAGLPKAWKRSESSRWGEARRGGAWSRGRRGGPGRELPLLGEGCSPRPLARLLPLGLWSWFRRLLWIAVTGVKFHQRPAPPAFPLYCGHQAKSNVYFKFFFESTFKISFLTPPPSMFLWDRERRELCLTGWS